MKLTSCRAVLGTALTGLMVLGGTGATGVAGAATKKPSASLSGVTLNVGDEQGIFEGPLQAAGLLKSVPYKINWSTFVGGPSVVAAEVGGSVDVGEMSDPPPIFAQAAGDPIKIVAAQEPENPATQSNFAIVVQPNSPIHTVKQLKGKSVSLLNGTILQYIAIRALQKAGLSYSDINPVNVSPPSGATAALEKGSVDALVTSLAAADGLVQSGQGRIIATGAGLSRSLNYVVASDAALANAGKSAALADFVQRLAKAQQYVDAHTAAYAPVFAQYNSIPAPVATAVLKKLPIIYVPITAPIEKAQQSEANVFFSLKLIQSHLDTKLEFDTHLNSVVAKVTGSSGPTS
ncbi:MAG TPA: aliphatic sulfonate ABC transporter substrate-binding protein [Acidimicrobiales bacterium]|jgi:sulfonate transport system substrate-binding protein